MQYFDFEKELNMIELTDAELNAISGAGRASGSVSATVRTGPSGTEGEISLTLNF